MTPRLRSGAERSLALLLTGTLCWTAATLPVSGARADDALPEVPTAPLDAGTATGDVPPEVAPGQDLPMLDTAQLPETLPPDVPTPAPEVAAPTPKQAEAIPPPAPAPTPNAAPPAQAEVIPETPPEGTPEEAPLSPEKTAEAAPPVAPDETPPATALGPASTVGQSEVEFDPRRRSYQYHLPTWGVSLSSSLRALGKGADAPGLGDAKIRAGSIQFEYQPAALQMLGVFGIGAGLAAYPITPRGSIASSAFSLWSISGQVRYQARFFREQILVPVVGYTMESLAYHFAAAPRARVMVKGPLVGAMLLLNPFEPSAAAESFISTGISRTYLVAELRSQSGSDANVSFSGSSAFFGLRFEF